MTSPRGLWKIHRRVRSRGGSGSPSTVMRSSAVTLTAGEASTSPLSVTRPSAIIASASRREAMPARAMTLAMRSSVGSGGGAGTSAARGRGGRSSWGRSETWRPPASSGLRNGRSLRMRGLSSPERDLSPPKRGLRRQSGLSPPKRGLRNGRSLSLRGARSPSPPLPRNGLPPPLRNGRSPPRGGEPRWSGRPRGGRRPLSFPSLSAMGC